MEHLIKSIIKASKITRDDFKEALDSYLEDNYSQSDVDTITNFDSEVGIEKKNTSYKLYRGVFLNDVSEDKKQDLLKSKTYSDEEMSWTKNFDVAKAFALGTNIYEKDFSPLKQDQVGIVLEETFPTNQIIIDIDYAIGNEEYEDLQAISEEEVLVKQKKRNVTIKQIFSAES
jgi:hypothetical protein